MVGDERIRLFCALRLPDDVVAAIERWQRDEIVAGRPVPAGNLHVTLAFLGSRPVGDLEAVVAELRAAAAAAGPMRLRPRGYRETRSVGMLELDDEGEAATLMATDLHARLSSLGLYEDEGRRWLPHVTVVRFRERPRLRPSLPPLGTIVPSDAAAYLSRLRPGGAQYEVLESVALRCP